MTQIQHVTKKEMLRRTGANALGYTYPDKDLILLEKGLTGKKKQNVLAHEQKHIQNGEEGPLFGIDDALIGGGISALGGLFGGSKQSKSDKKALKFQQQQAAQTRADLEPYRGFGLSDYESWEASPEGRFRFKQPGYGGQNVFTTPTQTSAPAQRGLSYADWTSKQTPQGGTVDPNFYAKYGVTAPKTIQEALQQWNQYSGGSIAPGATTSFTEEYLNPQAWLAAGGGQPAEADTSRSAYDKYLASLGGATSAEQAQGRQYGEDFRTDPAYKWRLDEGLRGLENSAIARGGALSGNAIRGLTDYAQNAASQEYGNIYNREYQRQLQEYQTDYQRKFGDVGLGYSAAAGGAQLGQQSANQLSALQMQAGQNQAANYGNVFGSIAGGLGAYQGQQQWQDFLNRAYPA